MQQRSRYLERMDTEKWRKAHQAAIDIYRPRREELVRIYEDALLDTHLQTVLNTRTLSVLNTPFHILDANGEKNEALFEELDKKWMHDIIRMVVESIYYGYSVIEFVLDKGHVVAVQSIDRAHAIPQECAVLSDVNGEQRFFLAEPPYNDFYLFLKDDTTDHTGLLLEASRYTVFKKQAVGFYSLYQEVYGFPYRIAKTDSRDKQVLDGLEEYLEAMGEAMYAILPFDAQFEIHESKNTDGQKVFTSAIELANKEISKRVLGQTMTTEDGSSRSQAEVHDTTREQIYKADIRYVEYMVNDYVLPLLGKHGYAVEGNHFRFDTSKSLKLAGTQLEVDKWIATQYRIDPEYITETYGTPILAEEPKPVEKPGKGKGSGLEQQLVALYHETGCCITGHQEPQMAEGNPELLKLFLKVAERLFKRGFKGLWKTRDFKALANQVGDTLYKGVEQGYGKRLVDLDYDSPDHTMLKSLKENVYLFSSFKEAVLCQEINALLLQDGRLREWDAFRELALEKHHAYNVTWLRTEYDAAIAQATMAARWQEAEQHKEDYMLRYSTVNDSRVREEHRRLEGITLPVDDPFWTSNYPPLGWGCRCDVELVPNQTARKTPKERLRYPDKVHPLFAKNVGKEKVIFDESHPYFKLKGFEP
ncbi:DUF935 family protein [Limibacter armeniacum]|uniref:phage portal protein family protein n=1 Tax=Limibacter armeniacum TaxID=466084 RepID=UPI002FE6A402